MNKPKLPFKIAEYIKARFTEDFLFEIKDIRKSNDRWIYTIQVSTDNYIHTIKIDDMGKVFGDSVQQTFPPDAHEEPTFEDIPE